jgi:hypothetical protein
VPYIDYEDLTLKVIKSKNVKDWKTKALTELEKKHVEQKAKELLIR